jgi:hypothetical protein
LEDVFEGGLEGMDRALISVLAALKLQSLVGSSSEFDPYRSKVAEEMLLCEVIVQYRICIKHYRSNLLMRVPCSRTARLLSLARQLPTTASIFKRLCLG